MLNVPFDLRRNATHQCVDFPGGCVVAHSTATTSAATQILVTVPSLIFVRQGIKHVKPREAPGWLAAAAGSIVVLRAGTHLMADLVPSGGEYASTLLCLEGTLLQDVVGQTTDQAPTDSGTPRAVIVDVDKNLGTLFTRLPTELADAETDLERRLKVQGVLAAVMEHPGARALLLRESCDWGDSKHGRVTSVMNAHCLSPLSVPEYAALCGMSLSSFKRQFRTTFNEAPGRWLTGVRLAHAKTLLATGQHSVTDVCGASGYRDLSNFIRAFRQKHGKPPSSFRPKKS